MKVGWIIPFIIIGGSLQAGGAGNVGSPTAAQLVVVSSNG